MRIQLTKRASGSAMLVVLIIGTVLSIMVGTFLLLVRYQNASVVRSTAWNSCIAISEAGIEEAMSQIHYTGTTNLSANAWTLNGDVYTKQRFLGDSYYDVTISRDDPPVIISAGYVALPQSLTRFMGMLAAVGVTNSTPPKYIRRTVRVATRRDGAFVKAMVAKEQIDFNGNNIKTDSFDSSDPNYSNNGQYKQTKNKDNGDVATNSGLTNSLSVGNANIYGHVATGPHGSVAIGSNGAVGSKDWQTGHTGIQPGWSTDDMNVSFPDVDIPYTSGWTPQTGTIGTKTYKYLLSSGNYMMADLSMASSEVLYVNGNANLYVTDSINLTGQSQIEIAPGGSLVLYMGGPTASFGGNEVVNNPGNALNFVYLGLPTNTDLRFVGNTDFTGCIYAPSADFKLGGGGSSPYDFVGASVSKTVTMNGHFKFHYDENLGKSRWGRGYMIMSWNEI